MNSNPKKTNTVAVAASQEDSYEPRQSPHQDQAWSDQSSLSAQRELGSLGVH